LSKLPEGRKPLPDEWFRERAQMQERIEELEAKLAQLDPNDGRPCPTDIFLVTVMDELDDDYDMREAVRDWIEGDWWGAVKGTTLAELKGEK
jgi:hypothetical protein